jgi:hypothetical protein
MSNHIVVMLDKVAETLKDEVLHGGVFKGFGGYYFADMEPEEEDCYECGGDGYIVDEDDEGNETKETCSHCGGDGYITTEPSHPDFDSINSEYYTFNDAFLIECNNFLATI